MKTKYKKIQLFIVIIVLIVFVFNVRCFFGEAVILDYTYLKNSVDTISFQFYENTDMNYEINSKEEIEDFFGYLANLKFTESKPSDLIYFFDTLFNKEEVDCFISCNKKNIEYCIHSGNGYILITENQYDNTTKMYLIRSFKNIFVRENILKEYVEQKRAE